MTFSFTIDLTLMLSIVILLLWLWAIAALMTLKKKQTGARRRLNLSRPSVRARQHPLFGHRDRAFQLDISRFGAPLRDDAGCKL